jgi:hypothetical protein
LTEVTSVPIRIVDVTPAAAVSVGTAPNHVPSRNGARRRVTGLTPGRGFSK